MVRRWSVLRVMICAAACVTHTAAPAMPTGATRLEGAECPALSPDGLLLAFEWCGDIWLASAAGGEAKRIVGDPACDTLPKFTPDGKRIVFCSDRSGSLQVHSTALTGGACRQHTEHSAGNSLDCLGPDGRRAIICANRGEAGAGGATRLLEIDLTGNCRERRLFDAGAHSAAWSPDGTRVLFCRGGEAPERIGYRGPRASQIWLYEINTRAFECKIGGPDEARWPVWLPDGSGFYYVCSGKGGGQQLLLHRDGHETTPLTRSMADGIRSPALSADGETLVFVSGSHLFSVRPGSGPAPVPLEHWTRETLPDRATATGRIEGGLSADCRDVQQLVFAAAGDLWWTARPGAKPVQLTQTRAAEEDVRFLPGGDWLCFLRDDGLEANYFRARLDRGRLRDEAPVTRGTRSKCRLKPSPDGSAIAWTEGTGDVWTAAADGGNPRRVFHAWEKPAYDWSGDSRWLAVAAEDRIGNDHLWIVPAGDAERAPLDLMVLPNTVRTPRWSPDNRRLAFTAAGQSDRSEIWCIDFGPGGPPRTTSDSWWLDRAARARRIPTPGLDPVRLIWSHDSESLWFQDLTSQRPGLYAVAPLSAAPRLLSARHGVPLRMTPQGSLLWRSGPTLELFAVDSRTPFPIDLMVSRPREDVLGLAFLRVFRTLAENFHDPRMNGVDWQALRDSHLASARRARSSRQFAQVVRRLCGRLNASHLAFTPEPWPEETPARVSKHDATAHPGLWFRDDDPTADAPLVIERVIPGSPAAAAGARPGDVVVRIAGETVSNSHPVHRFFKGACDRPLPVVLRDRGGRERVIELRCISHRQARMLEQSANDEAARNKVASRLPGAACLAARDLDAATIDALEARLRRLPEETHGLILDLRDNRGGREADRLLAWFRGPHATTLPRDGRPGYPSGRRAGPWWDHPLVVLCDEHTLSNSEIFCHAIQQWRRAPLVGAPTAGHVLTARDCVIPDAGILQVPYRAWFNTTTGKPLERHGAQPDHPARRGPADEHARRDPQLDLAIEVLRSMMAHRPRLPGAE